MYVCMYFLYGYVPVNSDAHKSQRYQIRLELEVYD